MQTFPEREIWSDGLVCEAVRVIWRRLRICFSPKEEMHEEDYATSWQVPSVLNTNVRWLDTKINTTERVDISPLECWSKCMYVFRQAFHLIEVLLTFVCSEIPNTRLGPSFDRSTIFLCFVGYFGWSSGSGTRALFASFHVLFSQISSQEIAVELSNQSHIELKLIAAPIHFIHTVTGNLVAYDRLSWSFPPISRL